LPTLCLPKSLLEAEEEEAAATAACDEDVVAQSNVDFSASEAKNKHINCQGSTNLHTQRDTLCHLPRSYHTECNKNGATHKSQHR